MGRLREEPGSRTVVVVRVVDIVRVELELAVVPVEDRRVLEATIGLRIFAISHQESPAIESASLTL